MPITGAQTVLVRAPQRLEPGRGLGAKESQPIAGAPRKALSAFLPHQAPRKSFLWVMPRRAPASLRAMQLQASSPYLGDGA